MAERIRNPDLQEDDNLKDDLQRYVVENFRRKEILDFVERDYPQYAWRHLIEDLPISASNL